jgi:serine/threonine-protein kinase
MIGKSILHYRIIKEIGKGGMGVVYKAEDTKLHRTVAIKALAAELIGDDKSRIRFMREARAASSIDHPNICTVYEINEDEDTLFFVMQHVEGKTLKKFIGGRPLQLDQTLEFSLQLADALAEAHRRNVIHRDIKASNIMINERGQTKILDFGLAKFRGQTESDRGNDLTQAGTPFGTASYMSPEQARGEPSDARSDIFSLGVVMYEMATGRLPFPGKTSVDVMHGVVHNEPQPMGPSVPQGLQQIILKAVAKTLADRYQSADVLEENLRTLVRGHYQEAGAVPVDKAALLHASTQPTVTGGGFLSRIASWVQRQLGMTPAKDESSVGASGETTISSWRTSDRKALAILPFKNLSGDPETDFYSFSLADSVITELAQLRELIVRPSSYIAQYQNKAVDPREVGSALAVDAVLVGGYIKSGDRFRVTPQLVDVNTGEIIWSGKIDVDARDIITVQDTISREIAAGLRVKTASGEHERLPGSLTQSPEAYESYLKGRTLLYKFTTQTLDVKDIEAAIEAFKRALANDPDFANAHSALGLCYLNYVLKGIGGREYYALAKRSFDRALDMDPRLVEPRVRLVYIDLIEGDPDVARREVRQLLKRAPNEASVHSTAAYVYRLSGQYDRALAAWDDYLRISPTDVVFASYNRARIYNYRLDHQRAEEELKRGLAFEPNHPLLHAYRVLIEYRRGELDKAVSHMEEVLTKNPELCSYRLFLAYGYHARGERDRAFALVDDRVRAIAQADQDAAYWLASLYALDGSANEAIEWLNRAVAMGNENYPWFKVDPNWDRLRDEPRYKAILEQLRKKWEAISRE